MKADNSERILRLSLETSYLPESIFQRLNTIIEIVDPSNGGLIVRTLCILGHRETTYKSLGGSVPVLPSPIKTSLAKQPINFSLRSSDLSCIALMQSYETSHLNRAGKKHQLALWVAAGVKYLTAFQLDIETFRSTNNIKKLMQLELEMMRDGLSQMIETISAHPKGKIEGQVLVVPRDNRKSITPPPLSNNLEHSNENVRDHSTSIVSKSTKIKSKRFETPSVIVEQPTIETPMIAHPINKGASSINPIDAADSIYPDDGVNVNTNNDLDDSEDLSALAGFVKMVG